MDVALGREKRNGKDIRTLIKRGRWGATVGRRPRILNFDVLARRHVHRHRGEVAHVEEIRVRVLGRDVEIDHGL